MEALNRRRFLKAASGLFIPATFGIARAQMVLSGPIMRPIAEAAAGCTTAKDAANATAASVTTDGYKYAASKFAAASTYDSCKAIMWLKRTGTLAGTVQAQLWSHNSGTNYPSTLLDTSDDNKAGIGTTAADITFSNLITTLTSGSTYWIGIYHSGGGDWAGTYVTTHEADIAYTSRVVVSSDGSTWEEADPDKSIDFQLFA